MRRHVAGVDSVIKGMQMVPICLGASNFLQRYGDDFVTELNYPLMVMDLSCIKWVMHRTYPIVDMEIVAINIF